MKIKIRDSKTIKDSIELLKKKIKDAEIDLTKEGVKSIANALLERKEEIGNTTSFANLRDIVKEVIGKFDTPKSREYLIEIDKLDRLYKRDPRPGSRNDYWNWEKLLKYVWNIILKASGNPSPDAKKEVGEKEVKEELGHMMKKHDSVCKDEEDEVLEACRLIGEAHDKLIEAMDLVESLENQDILSSELRYALEDIESPLSDLDMMGESDPREAMLQRFSRLNDIDEYDIEDYEIE